MAEKSEDKWCPHGSEYKKLHAGLVRQEDGYVHHIATKPLAEYDVGRPQFREWRRLAVREALKRGLIAEDPGGAP